MAFRRMATFFGAVPIVLVLHACSDTDSEVVDESKLIDLTHAFDERSVYWPTAKKFDLEAVSHGLNESGWWYASNDFSASEHGGTHLDAPIHFARGRWHTAEIPLQQLIGPARVIDIRIACETDPDYLLQPADLLAHEARHGAIPSQSIVLIHTGFGRFYPDLEQYLGSKVRGRVEGLHFPGIGLEAAEWLAEREVDLIGIDTASLDRGASTDFMAHRILAEANIPGLENVANLELLPPSGATVMAFPMKIADGTGGPCRVVALLP